MPRYMVVTADSSEDQIFVDFIVAKNRQIAWQEVVDDRSKQTDGHLVVDGINPAVFTQADLRRLARQLENYKRKSGKRKKR